VFDTHSKRYVIDEGTIGFGRVASIGKVVRLRTDLLPYAVSPTMAIIKPNTIDANYLAHFLKGPQLADQIGGLLTGTTRSSLGIELLRKLKVSFPYDEKEQKLIGQVLSTLDQAIEQAEAIISKQQQVKAGLMQDLLTNGIDKNGVIRSEVTHEFKDSSLGRIPVEWDVVQLSELADAIDPQPDHRTPSQVDDGIPYIGISDFNKNGSIDFAGARKVSPTAYRKQRKSFHIEDGDFVFGKIGTIGLPKLLPSTVNYALSANVILLKPKDRSTFVYWWMVSPIVENLVALEIHSTSQPAFGIKKIRSLAIPKITIDEQDRIGSTFDGLAINMKDEVDRLAKFRKLKAGLMHDLLTGKVRVKY
jgi:type I restriction enzyme S subunit